MSEADTCRKYVVPKLTEAGWDDEPHLISEQRYFTDGRIVVAGNKARRRPQLRQVWADAASPDRPRPGAPAGATVRR